MTTIHTASELLVAMRNCGFTIQLDGDILEVNQARWIDDELAYLIKTYKDDLITILEKEGERRSLPIKKYRKVLVFIIKKHWKSKEIYNKKKKEKEGKRRSLTMKKV